MTAIQTKNNQAESAGHGKVQPANLAHHFTTPTQQFSAAKLGMWLFLATEILMFGGLFCAYGVYRANHPDMFIAGHRFLDMPLGAINTVVLISSSFTMAWAVRCSQINSKRKLVILLILTLLGGVGFCAIKSVEYYAKWEHGLFVGRFFDPDEHYLQAHLGHGEQPLEQDAATAVAAVNVPVKSAGPDSVNGRKLFLGTCASCHGAAGEGVVGQGADLRESAFIAEQSDKQLLAFIKVGRQSFDPASKMGLAMPPRGGNPAITDDALNDIIAYVRELQNETQAAKVAEAEGDGAVAGGEEGGASRPPEVWIPASIIEDAPVGPAGLADRFINGGSQETNAYHGNPVNVTRADLRMFFSIYFTLTGLHALHVLIGMCVISWLLIRALKGDFGSAYYTPVEIGGLYWHLVDLIWIFLFPLLYLIH